MAAKTVITEENATNDVAVSNTRKKRLVQDYKNEKAVEMYLSPMYANYFGRVMTVMINGVSIYFKVDGTTQKVPRTFADEITARRMNVDKILLRKSQMSDVRSNAETHPGQITLF